jgi:Protein of unknown function (DUF2934)
LLRKGGTVSELPHRNEAEQAAIRKQAYRLWEEAGRPDELELELWLNAEAKLEAEGEISVKPIALPIVITFTAANPTPTWPQAKIICPVPGLTTDIKLFELASTEQQYASPELNLNPGLLAHDYRLTLLQATAATAAFDRIARLIEWFADQDKPLEPLLFQYPHDHSFYLAPEYFWALFQPQAYGDKIAEIDRVLGNYPYARAVTFDLELISLGSNLTFKGRVKAAAQAAVMALPLFLGSTAPAQAAPWLLRSVVEGAAGAVVAEGLKGGYELLWPAPAHPQPAPAHPHNESRQELQRKLVAAMSVGGPKGVMAVQWALKQLGLYDGRIDGDPRYLTGQAMGAFTAKHNILNDYPGGLVAISVLAADVSEKAFP